MHLRRTVWKTTLFDWRWQSIRRGSGGLACPLGGGLLRLLPLAHLAERDLVIDVGDRARTGVAELAGRVAPTLEFRALGLAEDGDEDLRLLVAVAGQRTQASVHLVHVVDTQMFAALPL
jgi:hypothetical protein